MGICTSTPYQTPEAKKASVMIDKVITKDKADIKIKLLLLGTGECGKSTFLKQMKLLHGEGFTEKEISNQSSIIRSNMVYAMIAMLRACRDLKIANYKQLEQDYGGVLFAWVDDGKQHERFSSTVHQALKHLWATEQIQEVYRRRNEYQLSDGLPHFFDDIDRVNKEKFKPTTQDMLFVRVPTTGIVQVLFTVQTMPFWVFDVAGQRTERRKWIHVFDDVSAIIFVVALSEYDQVLAEDGKTNRMVEALTLFGQMCNNRFFKNTNIILFLNKNDLFQEKIKLRPITLAFPEYEGEHEEEESRKFIERQFKDQNENSMKEVFCHVTCATNTDQVELIIKGVIDTVLQKCLSKTGLVD